MLSNQNISERLYSLKLSTNEKDFPKIKEIGRDKRKVLDRGKFEMGESLKQGKVWDTEKFEIEERLI